MSSASATTFGYGIIIDAGSSGSRIHLFRWPNEQSEDQVVGGGESLSPLAKVEQQPIYYDERHIGISNAEQGLGALEELLASAKSALPSDANPNAIPIHLGATAGMRLLASEEEADAIMNSIRTLFHNSGFQFQDDWARTITGEEESVYGWLVANYLRNNGEYPESDATYGALDLGGASTQISMVSTKKKSTKGRLRGGGNGDDDDELYPLQVGNLNYPLYTQSYLYYGADQARLRIDEQFGTGSDKVNPCYPTGYTNEDNGVSGSSNWNECFDIAATLFEHSSSSTKQLRGGGPEADDNSIVEIAPPPVEDVTQLRFIAMSVFVFAWDFLGLEIGQATHDLQTLKAKAETICALPHSEQSSHYDEQMKDRPAGRKTNKPFAQCFNAAFSYHLLNKGYGLPVEQTPIEIYYDINGGKVQWALGMMLVEASRLRSSSNDGNNKNEVGGGMMYGSSNAILSEGSKSYAFVLLIAIAGMALGSLVRRRRVAGKSS